MTATKRVGCGECPQARTGPNERYRNTRPDFDLPNTHDELRYGVRHDLMQNLSRETLTFRNSANETALPMRQFGSFLLGEGVGGALRAIPSTSSRCRESPPRVFFFVYGY